MRLEFDCPASDLEDSRLEVCHFGSFKAFIKGAPAATDLDGARTHVPDVEPIGAGSVTTPSPGESAALNIPKASVWTAIAGLVTAAVGT